MVCDDVHGLDVDGFRSVGPADAQPIVRLVNVSDALLRGCVAPEGTDTFLQVTGAQSGTIAFRDNVMSQAKLAVGIAKEVDPEAIDLGDKGQRVEVR